MSTMERRYDDLRAMFINCTLKRSLEVSNTQGLIDLSRNIMEKKRRAGGGHPRGRPRHRHRGHNMYTRNYCDMLTPCSKATPVTARRGMSAG